MTLPEAEKSTDVLWLWVRLIPVLTQLHAVLLKDVLFILTMVMMQRMQDHSFTGLINGKKFTKTEHPQKKLTTEY